MCFKKIILNIKCITISLIMAMLVVGSQIVIVQINAVNVMTTSNYDNYNITYSITNEWENNQNVELTITNTSTETIYNWALSFDASGEVSGLWNGTIYDNKGTTYIIKNAEYNYEIQPDESVTFGYTLSGDNLDVPKSFELCSKRVNIADGYNTQLVT